MTIRTVRLRASDIAHARSLFTLMSSVFEQASDPLGDSYIESILSNDAFWAVAAFSGDEIVGGLTAHTLPMTRSDSSEILIYDIAVRADQQRRGVGRQLVAAVRALAAQMGIDDLFVLADNDDAHALDFYRALKGAAAPVTMFTFGNED